MSFRSKFKKLFKISKCFLYQPRLSLKQLEQLPYIIRGSNYSQQWESSILNQTSSALLDESKNTIDSTKNPLKDFFDSHETGRGIWKWNHYFDIYHHHLSKFVGQEVHILEIGVYSGGSLDLWRHYFGPKCKIYGVDIEDACKCYENEYTEIYIGDQEDRDFWKVFKKRVPAVDIIIDDGGHQTAQQIVTLEEMLPHLRPGGVYLCEDVHGNFNGFSSYVQGLISNLNSMRHSESGPGLSPTQFQSWIRSVHSYPFVTVLEKADIPVKKLVAPKKGTEWQPY